NNRYSDTVVGVVVYNGKIAPSGVVFDIACSNKAVQTNIKYADIKFNFSSIMDDIAKEVRFGVGKSSLQKRNHEVLEDSDWEVFKEIGNHEHDQLKSLAR